MLNYIGKNFPSDNPPLRKTFETPTISYANVAQLVEQRIRNARVAGSNPAISSKQRRGCLNLRQSLSQIKCQF